MKEDEGKKEKTQGGSKEGREGERRVRMEKGRGTRVKMQKQPSDSAVFLSRVGNTAQTASGHHAGQTQAWLLSTCGVSTVSNSFKSCIFQTAVSSLVCPPEHDAVKS